MAYIVEGSALYERFLVLYDLVEFQTQLVSITISNSEAQLEGMSEEDKEMMAAMGFAGFDSTKV